VPAASHASCDFSSGLNTLVPPLRTPACSVPFVRPLELSAQFNRSRSDGEWDTAATPKFKVNLISSAIGKPGLAVTGTVTYDFSSHDVTQVNLTVPVTHPFGNSRR